ncbi:MAG: DEAD/DEAH box helicase family protein [Thermomicrobiales bacterium]
MSAWLARETAVSLGQAAELFFPPALAGRTVELLTVSADRPDDDLLTASKRRRFTHWRRFMRRLRINCARAGKPLTSILPALIKLGAIDRRITIHPHEPKANTAFQIRLAVDSPPALKAPRQKALVSYLDIRLKTGAGDGWIDEATALRASGASRDTLNRLIAAELVVRRAVNRAVLELAADFAPTLTPEQAIAWREMETLLESEHPSPLLLRGVTGSGKTELYLRAIAWALRKGESAIILAPEIALATHLVRRVSARFPADTVTIHSQQSTREPPRRLVLDAER